MCEFPAETLGSGEVGGGRERTVGSAEVVFEVDPFGTLVVRPTAKDCISLRVTPDGVEAFVAGVALPPMALAWDDCGPASDQQLPEADRWNLAPWTAGRGGAIGLALHLSGRYGRAADGFNRVTHRNLRRKLVRAVGRQASYATLHGLLLPIVPTYYESAKDRRRTATLCAFTEVLTALPGLRPRLADPARTSRLAADLAARQLARPVEHYGVRRDTSDILHAMRAAGFVHRFGRPIAPLPPLTDAAVVTAVREHLDDNPYRQDRDDVGDERILEVVFHEYLDVEPWPFAALT